ncbi:MAG: tRNA lysidine(34) synthetase TilS [Paludibacteraceae bacterium]|nr:tRNA lysidine(34) synthetase TilS [Paludibacteraceae bacterium]
MLRRVSTYIRKQGLLEKDKPVLVAVSGGADSVGLLDVLLQAGYTCIAAHCNFHLRGEESNRDEQYVRELCARLNTPLYVASLDTASYAREHAISIEMAAREQRYTWFGTLAQEHGCQAIAVAHHQNDQAETVLLNLLRGTGLRGLAGMRPKSPNAYSTNGIPVVRPLLCTTRDYIELSLRTKRHLTWVTDSTNTDTSIPRNALRAQLRLCSKKDIEHIAETAERMQGYVDILEGKDTREARLVKLYEDLREYNFAEIDKIYEALQRGEGGKTFHSKTHTATIKHRQLCVTSES